MQEHSFWSSWARFLHRWGLSEPAAVLLEAAGPLPVLLAHVLYVAQPFGSGQYPGSQWEALAELLEDGEQRRVFAQFLRREGSS